MAGEKLKHRLQIQDDRLVFGLPYKQFDVEMDAYRHYISENLPGFINFMEVLNFVISKLEDNLIMSNVHFTARLKDAISSIKNSSKKTLDDVFGFELITPNETDKEVLMLLIHKIFDDNICFRNKKHDKSNGYRAYHCVGVVKQCFTGNEFDTIEEYILTAKTKRIKEFYKDLPKDEQKKIPSEELFEQVDMYPRLKQQIIDNGTLYEDTINALKDAIYYISQYYEENDEIRRSIPPIEIQFKTAAVAEEAIYGKARHALYKEEDAQIIINKYNTRKLMRGMDFPFKFQRENGRMKLQTTTTTLIEMWPFLKETIRKFKKQHPFTLASYDMHLATVFPELKPYIKELSKKEPCLTVRNQDKDAIWRLLKLKIINPDFTIPIYKERKSRGEKV